MFLAGDAAPVMPAVAGIDHDGPSRPGGNAKNKPTDHHQKQEPEWVHRGKALQTFPKEKGIASGIIEHLSVPVRREKTGGARPKKPQE
jgi:hypothetical protein